MRRRRTEMIECTNVRVLVGYLGRAAQEHGVVAMEHGLLEAEECHQSQADTDDGEDILDPAPTQRLGHISRGYWREKGARKQSPGVQSQVKASIVGEVEITDNDFDERLLRRYESA